MDAFLYRAEKKGLDKRLKKGETPGIVVAVQQDERQGILAVCKTRLVFVHKKGLGTKAHSIHRGDVAGVSVEKRRYGILVVKRKKGDALRFAFTARGDADRTMALLRPRNKREVPEAVPAPAARSRPMQKSTAGSEPRATDARRAKVESLYRDGILTKAEYEWQLESLR